MQYLHDHKHIFDDVRIGAAIPLAERQVAHIERKFTGRRGLPAAYREFLSWMGGGADPFLRGSVCSHNDLANMQRSAQRMLKEHRLANLLPRDAFVFWFHQGYQFLFFRSGDEDPQKREDPPVHWFNEVDHPRTGNLGWNTYPSFSQFLMREIAGHAQILQETTGIENGINRWFDSRIPVHSREHDAEAGLVREYFRRRNLEPGTWSGISGNNRQGDMLVSAGSLHPMRMGAPPIARGLS